MDPSAPVGKLTGMLLEQDVDQIVPLFFFPEMVRDLAARSSPAVAAHAHPRGFAWCRSYWLKSRRRIGCLILHTPPTATTNPTRPTPILAPSQLTVSRHVVPTRVRELKESSYILLVVRRRKRPPSS